MVGRLNFDPLAIILPAGYPEIQEDADMTTYSQLVSNIAAYLALHHGVATEASDEAAAKLVRDCGLSTILVKGIAAATLGESPRQTFGS